MIKSWGSKNKSFNIPLACKPNVKCKHFANDDKLFFAYELLDNIPSGTKLFATNIKKKKINEQIDMCSRKHIDCDVVVSSTLIHDINGFINGIFTTAFTAVQQDIKRITKDNITAEELAILIKATGVLKKELSMWGFMFVFRFLGGEHKVLHSLCEIEEEKDIEYTPNKHKSGRKLMTNCSTCKKRGC